MSRSPKTRIPDISHSRKFSIWIGSGAFTITMVDLLNILFHSVSTSRESAWKIIQETEPTVEELRWIIQNIGLPVRRLAIEELVHRFPQPEIVLNLPLSYQPHKGTYGKAWPSVVKMQEEQQEREEEKRRKEELERIKRDDVDAIVYWALVKRLKKIQRYTAVKRLALQKLKALVKMQGFDVIRNHYGRYCSDGVVIGHSPGDFAQTHKKVARMIVRYLPQNSNERIIIETCLSNK